MEEFKEKMRVALEKAIEGRKAYNIANQENLIGYYAGVADGKLDGLNLAFEILKEIK